MTTFVIDIEKGVKGEERPGHKYIKRTPKPGGGYDYVYPEDNVDHHDSAVEVIKQFDPYFPPDDVSSDPKVLAKRESNARWLAGLPEEKRLAFLHAAADEGLHLESMHQMQRLSERTSDLEHAARWSPIFVHDDMTLEDVERQIRTRQREHGVLRVNGHWTESTPETVDTRTNFDSRNVCVLDAGAVEQCKLKGDGMFTHNHPSSGPLSLPDFNSAINTNVTAIRAARAKGGFYEALRPEKGWPKYDQIAESYKSHILLPAERRARQRMDAWVDENHIRPDEIHLDRNQQHWRDLVSEEYEAAYAHGAEAFTAETGVRLRHATGASEGVSVARGGPVGTAKRGSADRRERAVLQKSEPLIVVTTDLQKGKSYPTGYISIWKDGPHQKQADGTWVPVTGAKSTGAAPAPPHPVDHHPDDTAVQATHMEHLEGDTPPPGADKTIKVWAWDKVKKEYTPYDLTQNYAFGTDFLIQLANGLKLVQSSSGSVIPVFKNSEADKMTGGGGANIADYLPAGTTDEQIAWLSKQAGEAKTAYILAHAPKAAGSWKPWTKPGSPNLAKPKAPFDGVAEVWDMDDIGASYEKLSSKVDLTHPTGGMIVKLNSGLKAYWSSIESKWMAISPGQFEDDQTGGGAIDPFTVMANTLQTGDLVQAAISGKSTTVKPASKSPFAKFWVKVGVDRYEEADPADFAQSHKWKYGMVVQLPNGIKAYYDSGDQAWFPVSPGSVKDDDTGGGAKDPIESDAAYDRQVKKLFETFGPDPNEGKQVGTGQPLKFKAPGFATQWDAGSKTVQMEFKDADGVRSEMKVSQDHPPDFSKWVSVNRSTGKWSEWKDDKWSEVPHSEVIARISKMTAQELDAGREEALNELGENDFHFEHSGLRSMAANLMTHAAVIWSTSKNNVSWMRRAGRYADKKKPGKTYHAELNGVQVNVTATNEVLDQSRLALVKMSETPFSKPLHRGVVLKRSDAETIINAKVGEPGRVVDLGALSSWSTARDVAESFANSYGWDNSPIAAEERVRVVMDCKPKQAAEFGELSNFASEHEALMGGKFVVDSVEPSYERGQLTADQQVARHNIVYGPPDGDTSEHDKALADFKALNDPNQYQPDWIRNVWIPRHHPELVAKQGKLESLTVKGHQEPEPLEDLMAKSADSKDEHVMSWDELLGQHQVPPRKRKKRVHKAAERGFPIGTVRVWADGPHRKVSEDEWAPVQPGSTAGLISTAVRVSTSATPKQKEKAAAEGRELQQPKKKPMSEYPVFDPTKASDLPAPLQAKMLENLKTFGKVDRPTATANLVALWHRCGPKVIEDGEKWYRDVGHQCVAIAERDGYTVSAVVGAAAALSPQCDWGENSTQADWMASIIKKNPVVNFDLSITKNLDISEDKNKPKYVSRTFPMSKWIELDGKNDMTGVTSGKRLSEYPSMLQAHILRCWSKHPDFLPDPGDKAKGTLRFTNDVTGKKNDIRWAGGDANMAKAIEILQSPGTPNDVFTRLNGHKVQNFYNAIISAGEVGLCIDTHAVNAAVNRYKPGALMVHNDDPAKFISDREIQGILSQSPKKPEYGVQGGYPLVADIYRDATDAINAERKGKEPFTYAQVQAILWLQWRVELAANEAKVLAEAKAAGKPISATGSRGGKKKAEPTIEVTSE